MFVLELHPKARVWQNLGNDTFKLEHFFFRHKNTFWTVALPRSYPFVQLQSIINRTKAE